MKHSKKLKIVYALNLFFFLLSVILGFHIISIAIFGFSVTKTAWEIGKFAGLDEAKERYEPVIDEAKKSIGRLKRQTSSVESELAILRNKVSKLD
ncbi:exported hypothetical protein [Vibrio coralliirubri]|uniref:hypothetical protein n=1 Tax=Vibrio coralliirubri TaxID=1516159 RepID=UPI000634805A|nr:hypothetical protein [Vibrio coralliirubri]CDT53854.1 exported hypothetical protein [Vibrio coralliirubri]